jgi:GntR family transcriptional regulator, transcriptional repressor for pyruvate dehydrogenase complex
VTQLKRIRQQKVYEAAMHQLLALIEDGTYVPGDRLPTERQLSDDLGISRASVRQALTGLAAMGLVESRPGDGSYVASKADSAWQTDASSALELLEARRVVESGTARLAALRRTEADLRDLEAIVTVMEEQVQSGVHPVDNDREFHLTIARAAHNPWLEEAMETLAVQMSGAEWQRIKIWGLRSPEQTHRIQEQHWMVFNAIRDRNPEAAEVVIRAHIDRIINDVHSAEEDKARGNGEIRQGGPGAAPGRSG